MVDIVEKTDQFVLELFKEKLDNNFLYHNYTHAKRVLESVQEIIEESDFTDKEKQILQLAALLHDTGYIITREGHEGESVKIATKFLEENNIKNDLIEEVNKCIMATKFSVTPKSSLEEIIKDADTSHFGSKDFEETSALLRKELELQDIRNYTAADWSSENIEMLAKRHKFFTEYAIENWQSRKEKNIAKLMKQKKKKKSKLNIEKLKAKYKARYKDESPERAIQSLYRVTLRNHIKLSDIADTKANILLSVNAIIISLVLSNLISKLDNPSNKYLIIPTVIFVLFSVVSMILSILATRPNITSRNFSDEDVENKKVNLTFFGNFQKMELKPFQKAFRELLKDKEYIYDSMSKDLYFLGNVLDRKYKLLRLTYTIFMSGIIISIIAFAISFNYHEIV